MGRIIDGGKERQLAHNENLSHIMRFLSIYGKLGSTLHPISHREHELDHG